MNVPKIIIKFTKVDIINTLKVNRKLPLKQFVKFPIWIYRGHVDCLKGFIKIDNDRITTGMIRLGLKTSGMCGAHNGINLDIKGGVIFKGPGYMGNNSVIECGANGVITFGKNFGITGLFRIASRRKITIGDNFSSSWNVGVYDTDFHNMVKTDTKQTLEGNKKVEIGDDCWLCQNVTVLKGTVLPRRTTVSCMSLVNKDFKEENTILAGLPAKIVKRNTTREEFINFEKQPIDNIIKYLCL